MVPTKVRLEASYEAFRKHTRSGCTHVSPIFENRGRPVSAYMMYATMVPSPLAAGAVEWYDSIPTPALTQMALPHEGPARRDPTVGSTFRGDLRYHFFRRRTGATMWPFSIVVHSS
jgi:hypothetical protein